MEKKERTKALMFNLRNNYNLAVLGRAYDIILCCHLFRDYKNITYPLMKKSDLKRKDSKFVVGRPDLDIILFYEIIETTITDYYSRFKYHIYKTIPETFEYMQQVEFFYVNEDECLVSTFFIFNNKIIASEKYIKEIIQFYNNLYKSLDYSLRILALLKISIAYTTINSNIEFIWKI